MAAFLWAALAVYVATVLTVKRLKDGGAPKWLGALFGAASSVILVGWSIGAFAQPLAPTPAAAVLWGLALALAPALVEAARRATRPPLPAAA